MGTLDRVNQAGSYNLKGYVIANGLTSFMHDGYYINAIENLAHFNHIPISMFEEYQK